MWRMLENKVRRLVGVELRDPGFFVMHMIPPYHHDGSAPLQEYRIPCAKRADDFMVACWQDVEDHRSLYDALAYYMWEHAIVEHEVILKTMGWAGHFILENHDSALSPTIMVLEI